MGAGLELAAVGLACAFEHIVERGLLDLGCGLALTLLGADVFLRHHHADLASQIVDSFHKAHAGVVHQKADGIAVLAAAKAVIELLGGADTEGGRFFSVKRAQAHEVGTAFFQLHIAAHHVDNINAGQKLLEKGLRNRHGRYCPASLPSRGGWQSLSRKKAHQAVGCQEGERREARAQCSISAPALLLLPARAGGLHRPHS